MRYGSPETYGSPLQHAVYGQRMLPGEGLSMRRRLAVGRDHPSLQGVHVAQRRLSTAVRACASCRTVGRRHARGGAAGSGSCPASMAPSSICSTCSMRQVWKPLLCALMPRMACMATGGRSSARARGPRRRSRAVAGTAPHRRPLRHFRARGGGSSPAGTSHCGATAVSDRVLGREKTARPAAGRPAGRGGRRQVTSPTTRGRCRSRRPHAGRPASRRGAAPCIARDQAVVGSTGIMHDQMGALV